MRNVVNEKQLLSYKLCCITFWKKKLFFPIPLNYNQKVGKKSFLPPEMKIITHWKVSQKLFLNNFYYISHCEDPTLCLFIYGEIFMPEKKGRFWNKYCNLQWILWSHWALYWTLFSIPIFSLFGFSIYFYISSHKWVFRVTLLGLLSENTKLPMNLLKVDLLKQSIYPTPFSKAFVYRKIWMNCKSMHSEGFLH